MYDLKINECCDHLLKDRGRRDGGLNTPLTCEGVECITGNDQISIVVSDTSTVSQDFFV